MQQREPEGREAGSEAAKGEIAQGKGSEEEGAGVFKHEKGSQGSLCTCARARAHTHTRTHARTHACT